MAGSDSLKPWGHHQTIGIVGATGAVGLEMVGALHGCGAKPVALRLFASARSAGTVQETPYGPQRIEEFALDAVSECDIVLMAVSGSFAREFAPQIAQHALVIDNSSAFRYQDDIPLVIPEINPDAAMSANLIANPNCTTAIAAMALWPLQTCSSS